MHLYLYIFGIFISFPNAIMVLRTDLWIPPGIYLDPKKRAGCKKYGPVRFLGGKYPGPLAGTKAGPFHNSYRKADYPGMPNF